MTTFQKKFVFAALAFAYGCSAPTANNNITDQYADSLRTDSVNAASAFENERSGYRDRINGSISDIDTKIADWRRRREAEKDRKRMAEYDESIAWGEDRKRTFRERLDNLETRTESNWQDFKAEMDTLFNRNNHTDLRRD